MPGHVWPWAIKNKPTCAQIRVVPTSGIMDTKPVMTAQKKGSLMPKSQYPVPAAMPCIIPMPSTPIVVEWVVDLRSCARRSVFFIKRQIGIYFSS